MGIILRRLRTKSRRKIENNHAPLQDGIHRSRVISGDLSNGLPIPKKAQNIDAIPDR